MPAHSPGGGLLLTLISIVVLSGCSVSHHAASDPEGMRASYSSDFSIESISKIPKLRFPVDGGEITSRFGSRGSSFHEGVDIRADFGAPVLAAHSGIVRYSGNRLNGFGKVVIVEGDGGVATVYSHNRTLLVDKGDLVAQGEEIAEVGMTGNATGPHLHFELRLKDRAGSFRAVNPIRFFQFGASQYSEFDRPNRFN